MPFYEVPIIYQGIEYRMIEADNFDQAIEKAKEEFNDGRKDTVFECGAEWEIIDHIGTVRELEK